MSYFNLKFRMDFLGHVKMLKLTFHFLLCIYHRRDYKRDKIEHKIKQRMRESRKKPCHRP